jgi:hypothetical protein
VINQSIKLYSNWHAGSVISGLICLLTAARKLWPRSDSHPQRH